MKKYAPYLFYIALLIGTLSLHIWLRTQVVTESFSLGVAKASEKELSAKKHSYEKKYLKATSYQELQKLAQKKYSLKFPTEEALNVEKMETTYE